MLADALINISLKLLITYPTLEEEEEILYMFRPDNTSDHMQQGLMTLHHIISLQQ